MCTIDSIRTDIFIVRYKHSCHICQGIGKHNGVRPINKWTIMSAFNLTYSLSDSNIPITFTKISMMVSESNFDIS